MSRAVTTLTLVLLAGCAGPDAGGEDSLSDAMRRRAVERLANADHGLELRRWIIPDQPEVIAETMRRRAEPVALHDGHEQTLRRNGLRLVRVPVDELDALEEELGGSTMNLSGWHGQVLRWRGLHELPVPNEGAAVAIDGRVRQFQGGHFTLLGRSWPLPMESGPRVQLELVPAYGRTKAATDLRQLLGDAPDPERRRYASMAVDLPLEPGFAYILSYADPAIDWTPGVDDAGAGGAGVGPAVAGPRTLGRFLLCNTEVTPRRGMLLFIPRVPDELIPMPLAAGPAS